MPVYDQGLLVRTSIANVRDAILIGGLFSVLILLGFLKNLRATAIAASSIPLSLLVTFVFLHLAGDTLNLMSLGGLAVAIGLIIDDSVVVMENIARHLAEGQSGDEAIDRASKEISGAVIGSTLTTILVFVPLAFVRGVVGQFFQSLSLALAIALLVSMVISLTVIPVLAARFLAHRRMPTTGPIYRVLAEQLRGAAASGPAISARHDPPGASGRRAGLVALPSSGIGLHARDGRRGVHSRLLGAGGHFAGRNRQDAAPRRGRPWRDPRDRRLYPPHRRENGLFATEAFRGDILVSLKPSGERPPMESIIDGLRDRLAKEVPELEIEFVPLVQDQINDLNSVQRPVEVKLFGPDRTVLRRLAEEVGRMVEQAGGKDVNARVVLRQSRHRGSHRQCGDGAGRPDDAGRGEPTQRRASTARWPARCPSRTAS